MGRERWEQVERLYHAALDRGPDAREAFLNEVCACDEALRRGGRLIHRLASAAQRNPSLGPLFSGLAQTRVVVMAYSFGKANAPPRTT
jgi:hypothetical protein